MTRTRRVPPGEGGGRREAFEDCRALLFSVAYRMLGSVMDAEDVVQEAYLRWSALSDGGEEVRSPRDYLTAVAVRLCLDRLRSAKRRREEYVGPWLPEPLPTEAASLAGPSPDPSEGPALDESLSMAFMVLLESLTPTERAVFLMRDVFGYDYNEISRLVGKGEANCRQIASRARQSVASRRPRFEHSPEQEKRLTETFLEASLNGDMDALLEMLSEDIILYSDGGGRVRAALNPIYGADKVARFIFGVLGKAPPGFVFRHAWINFQPGVIGYYADGQPQSVATFDVAGNRIRAIRLVVNPEKLGSVPSLKSPAGKEAPE